MAKILSLNRLRRSPSRLISDSDKSKQVNQVEQEIMKILQTPPTGELSLINTEDKPKSSTIEHNKDSVENNQSSEKSKTHSSEKRQDKHDEQLGKIQDKPPRDESKKQESSIQKSRSKDVYKLSNNIIPNIYDNIDVFTINDFYNNISKILTTEDDNKMNPYNLKWHNKNALNLIEEITDLLKETYPNKKDIHEPSINSNKVKWTNLHALFQDNDKLNKYQSVIISNNSQVSLLPTLRVNCIKVKLNMLNGVGSLPLETSILISQNLRKYDIYIENNDIVINASSLVDFFIKLILTKLTLLRKIHIESFTEYYFSFLIFIEDGCDSKIDLEDRLELIEKFCLSS